MRFHLILRKAWTGKLNSAGFFNGLNFVVYSLYGFWGNAPLSSPCFTTKRKTSVTQEYRNFSGLIISANIQVASAYTVWYQFYKHKHTLHEKCPYSEFFLVCICILVRFSVWMPVNTDQKNPQFDQPSRSGSHQIKSCVPEYFTRRF